MQDQAKKQIFLLSGWGFDNEALKEFLSCLKNDYSVTRLNIPGYGKNVVHAKTKGLDAAVDELLPQIQQGGILCGWSLGGILAIKLAWKLQDRIHALVLITSTPCFVKKEDWKYGVEKNLIVNMIRRIANGDGERVLKEFSLQVANGDKNSKKIKRHLDKILTTSMPDNDVLIDGLEILAETDLRHEFQQLTCPLFLFLSDRDDLIASASGKEIKKLNPTICLDYLDDSGHAPFLSDPGRLAGLIKKDYRKGLNVAAGQKCNCWKF